MIVTAKDLRFKISLFFDILSKGEEITITYRGKPKAKLIPYKQQDINKKSNQKDALFGLWKDRDLSVNDMVKEMRKSRDFGL